MEHEALRHRPRTPPEDVVPGGGDDAPQHSRLTELTAALNSAPPVQRLAMMNGQALRPPPAAQRAVIQAKVFTGEEELSTYGAVRNALVRDYGAESKNLNSQAISRYLASPDHHDLATIAAELGLRPVGGAASVPPVAAGGGIPSVAPAREAERMQRSSSSSSAPAMAGHMSKSAATSSHISASAKPPAVHGPEVPAPEAVASSSTEGRGPSLWSEGRQDEHAPPKAWSLMEKFAQGGLLISTLQSESLVGKPRKDLVDAVRNNIMPEKGVRDNPSGDGLVQDLTRLQPEQLIHPTLNWSVAHRELIPSYYGMTRGSDGSVRSRGAVTTDGAAMRTVGMLADPYAIGDKFRSNGPSGLSFGKDNASSNTAGQGGAPIYKQDDATIEYDRLRKAEIAAQKNTPGRAMQTTEIKTLGFSPKAIVGFVATHIEADRPIIQEAVDAMDESSLQDFPVFTWEVIDGQTQLRYVETITKRTAKAAAKDG